MKLLLNLLPGLTLAVVLVGLVSTFGIGRAPRIGTSLERTSFSVSAF